jgi:hypothetical protein
MVEPQDGFDVCSIFKTGAFDMLTFEKGATKRGVRMFQNAVAGAALTLAVGVTAANASPIGSTLDFQFSSYTGNTNTVKVKVTQSANDQLTFDLDQVGNTGTLSATVAEFRAFYFSVADANLLSGASVAGSDVTSATMSNSAVSQVPGDNDTKMNGGSCGGAGCVFDVGVAFGTPGLDNSPNGINTTSFTYTRVAGLDLSAFFATSGDIMGARMKPFGDGGSSKNACIDCTPTSSSSSSSGGPGGQEVPEPGTLGIFGAALLGLGLMRRRNRA